LGIFLKSPPSPQAALCLSDPPSFYSNCLRHFPPRSCAFFVVSSPLPFACPLNNPEPNSSLFFFLPQVQSGSVPVPAPPLYLVPPLEKVFRVRRSWGCGPRFNPLQLGWWFHPLDLRSKARPAKFVRVSSPSPPFPFSHHSFFFVFLPPKCTLGELFLFPVVSPAPPPFLFFCCRPSLHPSPPPPYSFPLQLASFLPRSSPDQPPFPPQFSPVGAPPVPSCPVFPPPLNPRSLPEALTVRPSFSKSNSRAIPHPAT